MREAEGVHGILKKMYENLIDKKVIIDSGKELNRDGKFNAMITT